MKTESSAAHAVPEPPARHLGSAHKTILPVATMLDGQKDEAAKRCRDQTRFRRSTAAVLLGLVLLLFGSPLPSFAAETGEAIEPARRQGLSELLFVVREEHDDWFHPTSERRRAETGSQPDKLQPRGGLPRSAGEAALCRLDLPTGQRDILWRWAPGDVQGWDLHPDERRCVLSVREGGAEAPYHLVEVDLTEPPTCRQLTTGPHDDIDPVYLPDGRIGFASSRSQQWGAARDARLFTLHLCTADGSAVRPSGTPRSLQRTPSVLPDGRIMLVDWVGDGPNGTSGFRLLTGPPDGPHYEAVTGLGLGRSLALSQARAITGSSKVVAIATPAGALTRDKGWLVQFDLHPGPESLNDLRIIGVEPDRWPPQHPPGEIPGEIAAPLLVEHPEFRWRHPYPLSADRFLATTDRQICRVAVDGPVEVLYTERELPGELSEARPLTSL